MCFENSMPKKEYNMKTSNIKKLLFLSIIGFILSLFLVYNVKAGLNDNVKASYSFENNLSSATGNYDFSNGSSIAFGTGKVGQAVNFSNNWVYTTSSMMPSNSSSTICAWSNQRQITTANYYWWWSFVGSANSGTRGDYYFEKDNGADANRLACSGTLGCSLSYTNKTLNTWIHYCFVNYVNETRMFVNGMPMVYQASTYHSNSSSMYLVLGGIIGGSVGAKNTEGLWDEFIVYNDSKTIAEIYNIYSFNVNGSKYPFTLGSPDSSIPIVYNITTTQYPSDINSSLIGYVTINATILNITSNFTFNSNSSATIYYNITTTLNNGCSIFENQVCTDSATKNKTMTKITNSSYTTSIVEREIFPGYYPFSQSFIDNTNITYNYSVYLNNNILFRVLNFTTNTNSFLSVEYEGQNLSGSSAYNVYYCNSSYTTLNPAASSNCELLNTITTSSQLSKHSHGIHSHSVIPINIRNVSRTQNSSFIFVGTNTNANAWNFEYVLNSSYNNKSFCIDNYNTWNCNTPFIFDIHLHQLLSTDSFKYWINFTDGTRVSNLSSVVTDTFNVTNQRPSANFIYYPNSTSKPTISTTTNTTLFFAWYNSTDFENDALTYTLYLQNSLTSYYITYNTTNLSWSWNTNGNYIPSGTYKAYTLVCDIGTSNCNTGSSDEFSLCENDFQKSVQPCTNNVKQIIYYDSNGCDTFITADMPVDNGTYENCVNYVYNKTVYDDDMLILGILFIFLIISLACAIFVHEAFFGLGALICALILTTFIYYSYPTITIIASVFFIVVLSGMWVLVKYNRK